MTTQKRQLWAADPHKYGQGKIHLIDPEKPEQTYCGRMVASIKGKLMEDGEPTCISCADAPLKRQQQAAEREAYYKGTQGGMPRLPRTRASGHLMNIPPAFQFYPDDFLGGVSDMTQGEVGAYILLLCHQWNRGSAPVQPDRQKLLAKGDVSAHVISKFPEGPDGLLRNERLEKERAKQAQYRDSQRVKGQKSGVSRRTAVEPRLNQGSNPARTEGQPDPQPNTNSPSPSPSPSSVQEEGERHRTAVEPRFNSETPSWEEFWTYCQMIAYPSEWHARDKFLAAEADNWAKMSNWRSYATRCRGWWEAAGRPQHPRSVNGNLSDSPRKRPPKPHVDAEWREKEWKWV